MNNNKMGENEMKYIFNYKDGRNYDDSITDGFRLETVKNQKGDILIKMYSFQKNKIQMTFDNNEAIAIAHSLLVATNSVKKVSIE